jgi:hypothetical protein
VSVTDRDGPDLHGFVTNPLYPLACVLSEVGLQVETPRVATHHDVEQLASSWARRLDIPHKREAWLLTAYSMRNTG